MTDKSVHFGGIPATDHKEPAMSTTVRVAIIGAAAQELSLAAELLSRNPHMCVDLFDPRPAPPAVIAYAVTDATSLSNAQPRLRLFGNVTIGVDVTLGELEPLYDAILPNTTWREEQEGFGGDPAAVEGILSTRNVPFTRFVSAGLREVDWDSATLAAGRVPVCI